MSHRYDVWKLSVCLAALTAFLLSGCTSMTSTKEDLQNVGEDEGVVIGSILITSKLQGEYIAEISKSRYIDVLSPIYRIAGTPENEVVFIRKLPVGGYHVQAINWRYTLLSWQPGILFNVRPRQTSYIGRLEIHYPSAGDPARIRVLDTRVETIEKLRGEHPTIVLNAVNGLARCVGFRCER